MTRIDSISPSPDRMGRYLVRFSDGQTMRLYRQTVQDFGLYPGLALEEARMTALLENAGAVSAKMRAVRIVTASNVSRAELETRLVRKGEAPEQAAQAVQWMQEMRLVDDEQTARQIVAQCVRKGYGPARAKQTLYEKRIPKALWEAALADYPDQTDYLIQFLRRRVTEPTDPGQTRRAIDALLRRGHSYQQIRRALELLGENDGDYPEDEF